MAIAFKILEKPDKPVHHKLDWPVKGDSLYQFLTINERDEIEHLLLSGQKDEVLKILRNAYKWVWKNKNLYTDVEGVLWNLKMIAGWVKEKQSDKDRSI